jgi:hypothetical protein
MKVRDEIIISDPRTKIIERVIKGHSLCKALAQVMANTLFRYPTTLTFYDMIGNGLVTVASDLTMAATQNGLSGIVIGSGDTTPEAISNLDLDVMIVNGVAAGQISYGPNVWVDAYLSGATWVAEVQKTFTNLSGADITVKELGLTLGRPATIVDQILLARVLSTFVIANTLAKTVTWRIIVT